MNRAAAACVLVALLVLAAPAAYAQTGLPGSPAVPVIVTQGSSQLKRAPDQAWVAIAAEARAPTPADAQRQAAEAMTAVQKALRGARVSTEAIRTTGYTLQPDIQYENGRSRVRGYIARNQIEVRVDDLDRLGAVIDAAGASGATSMSNLRFDLKDRAAAEREALRLAVEDAMARARAIAAGAGASLGPIVRLEEHGGMRPQPPMPYAMAARESAQAPTPITPGQIEITAQVTATVQLR
jgi:uncharacterized protein YggE